MSLDLLFLPVSYCKLVSKPSFLYLSEQMTWLTNYAVHNSRKIFGNTHFSFYKMQDDWMTSFDWHVPLPGQVQCIPANSCSDSPVCTGSHASRRAFWSLGFKKLRSLCPNGIADAKCLKLLGTIFQDNLLRHDIFKFRCRDISMQTNKILSSVYV